MGKIHEYLNCNYDRYPEDCGIIYREDEAYFEVNNKEIYQYVNSVVSALKDKYKNVAIIGGNKLEWLVS